MGFLLFLALGGAGYFGVTRYNDLQRRGQQVREAHSNIMVSMKKRVDLANKLVDIAVGYGDHEKLTHLSISKGEGDNSWIAAASTEVASVVNHVVRLATHYPELRASETYQMLMGQLDELEGNLQLRREQYNGMVRDYNISLTQIPTNLFAPSLGFKSAPYFDVENADALENLKGFVTDDGEMLKAMLSDASRRVVDSSRVVGRKVLVKSKEISERSTSLPANSPTLNETQGTDQ